MTDTLPTDPAPRHRLLRFLVPVLLAHGVLLAVLPYWSDGPPPHQAGVDVRLAPKAAAGPGIDQSAPPQRDLVPPEPSPDTSPAARVDAGPAAPTVAPARPHLPAAPVRPTAIAAQTPPAAEPTAGADRDRVDVAARTATPAAPRGAPDWQDSYRQDLRAALARHHHYPERARRFGLGGEVLVGFSIARDGHFDAIHLVHGSSVDLLDQAALTTVRRLGRFRPLPAGYSEDNWAVEVPLVYRLD